MTEATGTAAPVRLDDLRDLPLKRLDGTAASLSEFSGKLLLIVNVASKCGYTPQYAGLQELYATYEPRGFTILGFPCNQFGAQEPGTAEEIATFCSVNYSVTFPLFEKLEVNGPARHPLYERLTQAADFKGRTGDIVWNFEKFLVAPSGEVVGRFSHKVTPQHEAVIAAVEAHLPG